MVSVPLFIMVVVIVLGMVGFSVMMTINRAHRVRVRIPTNKGIIIEGDYYCVSKKDKSTGAIWWKSAWWQKKLQFPEPPPEVIDTSKKGKKVIEIYRLSNDEFIYIRDPAIAPETQLEKDAVSIKEAFRPFTIVDREVIIRQFEKAKAKQPNNAVLQLVLPITCLLLMTVIIVVIVIYFGEISKAVNENMKATQAANQAAQRLYQQIGVTGKDLAVEIPQQQQGGITVQGSETPPRPPGE